MIAHCGKAQGNRFCLPVRTIEISAARAYKDRRPLFPREQLRRILQQIGGQGNIPARWIESNAFRFHVALLLTAKRMLVS